MLSNPVLLLILLIFLVAGAISLHGSNKKQDWPRWRGPNGDGISTETDWNPEAFKDDPKIVWKTNIGGGHSNVAIKGKYLYTVGAAKGKDVVYCLDVKSGEEIW